MSSGPGRAIVTGWSSFLHGEATAGDLLALDTVAAWLADLGWRVDVALSRGLTDDGVDLEAAEPSSYSLLVFACGPAHGWQVEGLHRDFAGVRRVAVGVSVVDPASPAVLGFHAVLPRDAPGTAPTVDLATGRLDGLELPAVAAVLLANAQPEYGADPAPLHGVVTGWLAARDIASYAVDTRVSRDGWQLGQTPAQVAALVRRADVVVASRMHGLVLGLGQGIPVLAVDPVPGGAKVTAQARAWGWPAVLDAEDVSAATLDAAWAWCRSGEGRAAAAACRTAAAASLDGLRTAFADALAEDAGSAT